MKKSDSSRSSKYPFLSSTEHGIILKLYIQPAASKNEIAGMHGGRLKIKLISLPVEGAANKLLIEFLAKTLDIKKRVITILHGMKAREKSVKIEGVSAEHLGDKLKNLLSV
ncbi:MAG: YggU family protein [Deltaproteobacteria bacterium GWC2_42_11]|nr:MAG: YggU family protein [Deltaproteobacteria bacterium GWC2_42_11]HBO85129.1 YggU family protein [Deltaproteobacteria bacterium]